QEGWEGQASQEVEVPPNAITADSQAITPQMLPLVSLSQEQIDAIVAQVPGGVGNVQDIYPLAPLQEGILFHHLMGGPGDVYLLWNLLAMDTRQRAQDFIEALQAVIARHDILRTAVVWEGLPEPVQVVWRQAPLPVQAFDLRAEDGDIGDQLKALLEPRTHRLDVRQAPLLHVALARDVGPAQGHDEAHAQGHERWLLMLRFHHLAMDHTALEMVA